MKQKLQKPLSKFSPKMLVLLVVPLVAFGVYTLLSSKAAVITTAVPTETTCPDRLAGKCRPYPDTSPWNTIIPNNVTEDSKSQTYIGAIKAVGKPLSSRVDQYTIPVWISNSTTPTQNLYMVRQYATYGANDNASSIVHWRNHNVSWPTQPKDLDCNTVPGDIGPTWPNFPIPANMVPSDGTDSHAVVWNTSTGVEYGLWRMTTTSGYSSNIAPGFPSVVRTIPCKDPAQGTGIAPPFAVPNGVNWTAWDGWAYNTNTPANYGTCKAETCGRASNNPLLAGLVRRWEIDQGKIEHAIAFAYTNPSVDASQHGRYPAVGTIYNTAGTTNDIPFGGRMQLRPDISDDTIQNTWGCKQACFTIAKALQKYGMYATDSSGSSKIFVEDNHSAQWSSAPAGSDAAQVYQDTSFNGPGYSLLNNIPWDNFRVVAQPCDPSTSDCSAYVTPAATSGPTANLWIDPNGGTCTRVSGTGAGWGDGTACPTLDAAWQKAVGGDIIRIKASDTPYAAFLPDSSKNPAVKFIGEGADTTSVSKVDTQDGSGGIVFQDLKIKDYYNRTGTNGITYQNVKVEGNFFIRGSSNITWDNVESYIPGNGTTTDNSNFISSNYSGGPGSDNIIIKNSYIHHYRRPATPVCSGGKEMCHVDCIAVDDVNILKIQNTRFEDCEAFSIIFGTDNGTGKAARNVTVENNIFNMDGGSGPVSGVYNIAFTDTDAASVIRFNSFIDGKGIGFTGIPAAGTITIDSNALLQNNSGNCNNPAVASWIKNVIASGACTGDLSANPKFVGGRDAHLQIGSPAIDKGSLTNYPPTDFSGAARFTGSAPDAGAYEYTTSGGTTKPGDVNNDGSVNISDISALLSAYGQTGTSLPADLDKNGSVNIADLSIILMNYGK